MPYTPPATHSPNASRPETYTSSQSQSRKPDVQQDSSLHQPVPRPRLPQSTSSYLHKHRRSPSVTKVISPTENVAPNGIPGASTTKRGRYGFDGSVAGNQSHSSPPTRPGIPAPGIMSPPESSHTSSDEETNNGSRGRDLVNLVELQDAIRIIEQYRTGSPEEIDEKTKQAQVTLDLGRAPPELSIPQPAEPSATAVRPPLSAAARKISHSRSNTDSSALRDYHRNHVDGLSQGQSESDTEELADDERRKKPVMVRKKSGELVRPALRPSYSKRRPSSMPGTPTFSKAVHFDPSLEHVRHFLQVDRPIAVSAGSSPVDSTLDDEGEYPFPNRTRSQSPPFEWEIRLTNFPSETGRRISRPVQVERVYLSSDNKNLMGAIVVQNLAFHKSVVTRFTLDYWKTTSEVVADFCSDIRRKHANDEQDRFVFSIKLEDQTHLENKTLVFCVRYNVNGQEFWDNNNSMNYHVLFLKKSVAQGGKNGVRGNSSRPLYGSRHVSSARPRSMPISSDDFATCFPPYEFPSLHESPTRMIGDSPLRFRNPQAGREATSDGSGQSPDVFSQAFAGRYDFDVSLSAAIHGASNTAGDRSKPTLAKTMSFASQLPVGPSTKNAGELDGGKRDGKNLNGTSTSSSTELVPQALTGDKPALQSSSYHELLDKYCFVRPRSAKATGEHVC